MKRTLLLTILLLTACAARVPWVNSRVPQSQWDQDWSACKRAAEYHSSGSRDWDDQSPNDPLAEYDRQKAKEQVSAEVASCMIGRGYVPAEKKK